MTHTITLDNEQGIIAINKFVTLRTIDGAFHTRIHAVPIGKIAKTHYYLIRSLFEQVSANSTPGDLKEACMGGGKITKSNGLSVEWGSSTLRETYGKDRPADEAIATALIGEIRAWVEARLQKK